MTREVKDRVSNTKGPTEETESGSEIWVRPDPWNAASSMDWTENPRDTWASDGHSMNDHRSMFLTALPMMTVWRLEHPRNISALILTRFSPIVTYVRLVHHAKQLSPTQTTESGRDRFANPDLMKAAVPILVNFAENSIVDNKKQYVKASLSIASNASPR
jgi:hypothetical protein